MALAWPSPESAGSWPVVHFPRFGDPGKGKGRRGALGRVHVSTWASRSGGAGVPGFGHCPGTPGFLVRDAQPLTAPGRLAPVQLSAQRLGTMGAQQMPLLFGRTWHPHPLSEPSGVSLAGHLPPPTSNLQGGQL